MTGFFLRIGVINGERIGLIKTERGHVAEGESGERQELNT
jgi:hypothetical protein